MPLRLERNDITRVKVDAIVNAANEQLLQGGGVCGAIFKAAGAQRLQAACNKIGNCATGQAVSTPAFALPAKYVIHTVGPIWQGGDHGERELLASCYRNSLQLAKRLRCRSIAFPLISAGIYGYPKREALDVAQAEIRTFLESNEMDVVLVLFNTSVMELAESLRLRIDSYIDDRYVEQSGYTARRPWENAGTSLPMASMPQDNAMPLPEERRYAKEAEDWCSDELDDTQSWGALAGEQQAMPEPLESGSSPAPMPSAAPLLSPSAAPRRESAPQPTAGPRHSINLPNPLRNLLSHLDASFSETLLTLIDERGLKDAQVYKRANISRQHFSKMRSNPRYRPTKNTVLALAVALELTLDETCMLLERAGFALSHADRRDIIVEFFIREGIYDIFEINDVLFAYDQPLLG